MKIENLRTETQADRVRVVATVIWENRDRLAQDIYFETTAEFASDISANPNAFLTACTLPAMHYGEKRIAIDAPICPQLKEGLITVMNCLVSWYGNKLKVIPIEAPVQSEVPLIPPRAGCFFSGGIDALCMLRNNHLHFEPTHPNFIKDGLIVYGILRGEDCKDPSFDYVLQGASAVAQDAGINLISVYTNAYAHLKDLDPKYNFWKYEYHGSFLAAVAHVFSSRLTTASIASTYNLANLDYWGSHPLLDPNYSSSNLQIRHEDAALSRLSKTKIVSEWDVALQHLRVCNDKNSYRDGNYNCGRCEKCVRTMTALLTLGLLDKTPTFKVKDVSQKLLNQAVTITDSYEEACYRELIPPLAQMNRTDLINGIRKEILSFQIKQAIKSFDRVFLDRLLTTTSEKLRA